MAKKNFEYQTPRPLIRTIDAVALVIGIIVGAGIFRTPSIVAAHTGSDVLFLSVWLLGGLVSLVGALCYAELATTFPHTGGDYHFLKRAYGVRFAFLFAWARLSVIQTGSIALLAYIIGDYLSQLYSTGPHSATLYAAIVVILLTVTNILGVRFGTATQNFFFVIELVGTLGIVAVGLMSQPSNEHLVSLPIVSESPTSIGLSLVFVLLTFGGWNEAGYLSAELKAGSRKMVWILVVSILTTTVLYLLINWSFLHALGIERLAASKAVGIDLMRVTFGESGVFLIGILVVMATLTSINATIFTGARTNYALGRDFRLFGWLGHWNTKVSAPIHALVTQGIIALILIGLGALTRNGFQSMVDFTAPVFWFFFLATGVALFFLRKKEPNAARPFKVPLYPLTPLIFCCACTYLLYASIVYTGVGAFAGVVVLLLGGLFFGVVR